MYDTLRIYYNFKENENFDYRPLEYITSYYSKNTDKKRNKYKLRNLQIFEIENGIMINGSIHKFHNENNISDMTREFTEKSLIELSEILKIDLLNNGIVRRIDFSTNILTKNEPSIYLNSYAEKSRYRLDKFGTKTNHYKTNKKELILYDKINEYLESKSKELKVSISKIPIPEFLKGKHILRIEMRLTKKLKSIFGKKILCKDLIEPEFYNDLKNRLKDMYFSIDRNKDIFMSNEIEFTNPKEYNKIIFLNGLIRQFGTLQNAKNYFKTLRKNKTLDKNQYKQFSNKIKELENLPVVQENELIKEIDKKFKRNLSINK